MDDADFEALRQYKWRSVTIKGKPYVIRNVGTWTKGNYRTVLMHRQILGLDGSSRPIVDHRNDNGLDNQRSNLRTCTNAQNMANRGKQNNNTSGYKGVFLTNKGKPKPWHARLGGNKDEWIHGGYFATAEEAARKYDELALLHYGEFAKLNFPQP